MMPTSLQVQSFDHLTLIVADLMATRHFYVDLLGLPEIARPDFDFEGLWFNVGNVQIHATVTSDLAGQAGWGDRGVVRLSRGHHFALQVADVETAAVRARELGIEIASELKQRPDGVKQLFVFDPDKHLIELFSI
jgi:catechol 2,3-dioxygenase-like lactoylglutathione lyase family enzyme